METRTKKQIQEIKLPSFDLPYRFTLGTVDYRERKAIYINIIYWYDFNDDDFNGPEEHVKLDGKLKRELLQMLARKQYKHSIVDIAGPSEIAYENRLYEKEKKRMYKNIEITLFNEDGFPKLKDDEFQYYIFSLIMRMLHYIEGDNRYTHYLKRK